MTTFMLKISPHGRVYIPRRLRHLLPGKEVVAVVGTATITLFRPGLSKEALLKSLELAKHEVGLTFEGAREDDEQ
ncbi:MAG: hypothetical protein ACTSXC_04710 [Candidatus Freyarchaeota archaeon]